MVANKAIAIIIIISILLLAVSLFISMNFEARGASSEDEAVGSDSGTVSLVISPQSQPAGGENG